MKTGDVVSMTVNEYTTGLMLIGRDFYVSDGEEWLPTEPLDVDARVYKELGEREFKYWNDDNTMPLADFIAELQALAAKAPKSGEVVIEISASTEYDESSASARYEVGYFRDPTKRERAEREETNRKIAERKELDAARAMERERAEFERLKAKFASDSDGNPKGRYTEE